jgi:hypothetical protein
MSVVIDNTEDLLALLKKLNLKIANVEELRSLLVTINANYNPEAARLKLAKLIGVGVPCTACGIAGVVSFFLIPASNSGQIGSHVAAIMAVLWGVTALVSVSALLVSFIMSCLRRGQRTLPDQAPSARQPSAFDRALTGITDQLP